MAESLNLARFCRFLADQHQAIESVYAEIEQVQRQFNQVYHDRLQEWQAAMSKAVPLLADGDSRLPPPLAQSLLEAVQQERKRMEEEIASLTKQVQEKRAEGDRALSEAQAEIAALRQLNPELNAQEEDLKARCAAIQQQVRDLDSQIKRTSFLSFIQRHRLRQQRSARQAALSAELGQLRRVRQLWADERKKQETDQVRLHGLWETAAIEAAQLQARLDYLQTNLDLLSRQNGASNLLAGLQAVPEAPEPLHTALSAMVELNQVKAAYEGGLRTVAEALGLLKGLAEGMERFRKSADKVLEEQQEYHLREIQIRLSDDAYRFRNLWPEFRNQVRDEKGLGTHPADFSRTVEAIIKQRFAQQTIAAVFDAMGEALNEATKAWG